MEKSEIIERVLNAGLLVGLLGLAYNLGALKVSTKWLISESDTKAKLAEAQGFVDGCKFCHKLEGEEPVEEEE